jgi:Outer membrane protein beta-barrel domain
MFSLKLQSMIVVRKLLLSVARPWDWDSCFLRTQQPDLQYNAEFRVNEQQIRRTIVRLYLLVSGLLMSGVLAIAQEETTPAVEVGANYSFVRYNSANGLREFTENGGSGYFAYNVNKALGLVVDLGAYNNGTNDFKTFSYLFGPRFNMRHSKFVPYVQFLFGGNYAWANSTATGSIVPTTQNGFATAAGGGLDIQLTKHVAFKPIQLEYLMSQLPHEGTGTNSIQNNLRYSVGVVLRLGSK